MSAELRIRPAFVGDNVLLTISGAGLPAVGTNVNRTKLVLNEQDLEQFRRIDLPAAQITQLSDAITDWLLDATVRGFLTTALQVNGGGLRLVIDISEDARPFIAQLPFELLWHESRDKPLLLRKDFQSLVYRLSKTAVDSTPAIHNWPFKALIVRARPADLPEVPEAAGIVANILTSGAHYGERMVQIDLLSNEAAVGKKSTWSGLQEQLKKTPDYNLLVYLGHGEITNSETGESSGHLFMESEDGGGHEPVSASRFARLLSDYPIGMVILAGCLTGADPLHKDRKRGGELGVGQALVNSSDASVQVAVAMRTELRTTAATIFIERFFESLFDVAGKRAGNVDLAVRHSRRQLSLAADSHPQWAAPMVLRATEKEPYFEFLATPATFRVTELMDAFLTLRSPIWNRLTDYSLAAGEPPEIKARRLALDEINALLRTEGLKQGPLLLPRDVTIGAGASADTVVEMAGNLSVTALRGRVSAGNDGWVRNLTASPAVVAVFQMLTDPNDPGVFLLRSTSGAPVAIPQGELLRARVDVPASTVSGVYQLRVEVLELQPAGPVWPGDGVVIVPRP